MREKLKEVLSLPLHTLVILFIGVLAWVFVVIIWPFAWNSSEIGSSYGGAVGTSVGTAIGSYNGLTRGFTEGKRAGETDATNSEDDIQAEIENSVQEIGKLEVLVAGFSVQNFHEIGSEYASLEILKGNAVFSVDLLSTEITFSRDGSRVNVILRDPDIELFINENETEQLAEFQKYPWSGSAENGYRAYLNSRANTYKEIKETMDDYDALMSSAKEAAIKEVTRLVNAVCLYSDQNKKREVNVVFKGGN